MGVNEEALRLLGDAAEMMGDPRCCPFCGMWWDQKVAERILMEEEGEGYAEWLAETAALPVNATGPDLGHRGPPIGRE